MYEPDVAIFTHVWVSWYETHGFLQVDGGQRDSRKWGVTLSTAYLRLSSYISTFDRNCICLKELIKIAYGPPYALFSLFQ